MVVELKIVGKRPPRKTRRSNKKSNKGGLSLSVTRKPKKSMPPTHQVTTRTYNDNIVRRNRHVCYVVGGNRLIYSKVIRVNKNHCKIEIDGDRRWVPIKDVNLTD